MRPLMPWPENRTISDQGKYFKNNVEVGGVEPAAGPNQRILFLLVSAHMAWSGSVFEVTLRNHW